MRVALSLTSLLVALWIGPIEAQDQTSIITGVVRDAQGQPLAGAEVFAGRTDKPAVTNEQGRFRISPAPSGRLWIAARKIGYAPVRGSITVSNGEQQDVELTMESLPVTLPEIKVVERSGMKIDRLNDYWRRSRTGYGGHFITRDDLERRNPITLVHVVRPYLPRAALARWEQHSWDYQYDFMFGVASARPLGGLGERCSPAISIDGGAALGGWELEDFPVDEVEAVEVYKPRWSEVPIEYQHYPRANRCGLVVIWRR
jgi:hypothetical protein